MGFIADDGGHLLFHSQRGFRQECHNARPCARRLVAYYSFGYFDLSAGYRPPKSFLVSA